jgi:hypothetical protein
MAAPSSALARADGMKKNTNSTTSQVNAWPPPMAMAPMVSTTTMAEMRKKMVSSRLSSRRSLARSASPAFWVVVPRTSWAVMSGPPHRPGPGCGGGRGQASRATGARA